MKLKLNHNQFMALYNIFQGIAGRETPVTMQAKLVHVLLLCIYQKLYSKAIEKKKVYNVKLAPQEAIAFQLFFSEVALDLQTFEGNLLMGITNSIHQKFI